MLTNIAQRLLRSGLPLGSSLPAAVVVGSRTAEQAVSISTRPAVLQGGDNTTHVLKPVQRSDGPEHERHAANHGAGLDPEGRVGQDHPSDMQYQAAAQKLADTVSKENVMQGAASAVKDAVPDSVSSAAEKAAERGNEAQYKVADTVLGAFEKTGEVISGIKDQAMNAATKVKDTVAGTWEEGAGRAKDTATNTYESVADKAKQGAQQASRMGNDVAEEFSGVAGHGSKASGSQQSPLKSPVDNRAMSTSARNGHAGLEQDAQGVSKSVAEAEDSFAGAQDAATNNVKGAYNQAKDTVKDALHGGGERANQASASVRDSAHQAGEKVNSSAKSAKDTVQDTFESGKGMVKEAYDAAAHKVGEAASKAGKAFQEDGAIGRQFTSEGAVGGKVQEAAEKAEEVGEKEQRRH